MTEKKSYSRRIRSKFPPRKRNRPPDGQPWIWLTREMFDSPAFRALTPGALLVVVRVVLEHLAHAGTMNGRLKVTWDQFADYGVRRKSVQKAIRVAEALGFIDVTFAGIKAYGPARRPAEYGLTWLWQGGEPATNRWRRFKTLEAAEAVVKEAKCAARPDPAISKRTPYGGVDIYSRGENAPGEILEIERSNEKHGGENAPGFEAKTPPGKNSSSPEHQLKETALAIGPAPSGGNGSAKRAPQREARMARARTNTAD